MIRSACGLAIDTSGNIYIADGIMHTVHKLDLNGIITTIAGNRTEGYSGDGGPATDAQMKFPYNVAVDVTGNLYIADLHDNRIRKVDTNGIITTVAGNGMGGYSGDGGPATDAMINSPNDVEVDAAGNLYIADTENRRIRKVDSSGIITTVVGANFLCRPAGYRR